jgi:histidine triad (HIT) family protein
MDNCVFCQIVARILPCDLIYEDDHFLAFLDINPVRQGHTLVISKEHHATMIKSQPKAEVIALIMC